MNAINKSQQNWMNVESARHYRKGRVFTCFSRVACAHVMMGMLETIYIMLMWKCTKMAFKGFSDRTKKGSGTHIAGLKVCVNEIIR